MSIWTINYSLSSLEDIVAQLVQSFVEDGVFLAYTPWVRYRERVTETRKYPSIPLDVEMSAGVMQAIITTLPLTVSRALSLS